MSDVGDYSFWDMRSKVRVLRSKLNQAISADQMEAASPFLQLGPEPFDLSGDFQRRADALVARANTAMASIETESDGKLRDNASVPRDLEADAEKWRNRANEARDKQKDCVEQRDIPEWSGEAKDKYVAAVMVQEVAMKELQGVLRSTAQGCDAGAQLNRAIFFAVGEATTEAMRVFRSSYGGGAASGWFYTRTANAVPTLEALVDQFQRAVSGEVADGAAQALATEMRDTVAMASVLGADGWPTGTSSLGVEAAATGTGVSSDGSDAETDVEAQIWQCLAGIHR